jgi:hypothetical protein
VLLNAFPSASAIVVAYSVAHKSALTSISTLQTPFSSTSKSAYAISTVSSP